MLTRRRYGGCVIEALAGHPDLAGSRLLEASDDSQQGGFAGSALTEDGEEFAFRDFERNILQDDIPTQMLGDGADGEQGSCADG